MDETQFAIVTLFGKPARTVFKSGLHVKLLIQGVLHFDNRLQLYNPLAAHYRAEGEAEALRIRAETDKEKAATLSEAYKQAELIKGQGDAEAMRIYAQAYGKDPTSTELVRTLEAYKKVLTRRQQSCCQRIRGCLSC